MAPRFITWTDVETDKRGAFATATRTLAHALEPLSGAFVELEPPLIGAPKGPFAHLPYAAKDMFSLPDRAPTCGLRRAIPKLLNGYARALQQLDAAGAVRLGFTEMTALAYEPSGYNAARAMPANPWDREFVTGGSSSGSGVAVASGAAVLALGSDTGGSVRIPGHCLGITAWKPTAGAVAGAGALPLAPSLDTIGVLARSAAEIAAVVLTMTDHDPDREPPLIAPLSRVLVFKDLIDAAEPSVRRACRDGLDALEASGVRLDQKSGADAIAATDKRAQIVLEVEAMRGHKSRLDDAALDAGLRQRLARGTGRSEDVYADAIRDHRIISRDFRDAFFGAAEAIALPVTAIRTPPRAECDPTSPLFNARVLSRLTAWTRFVNYLGLPAITLPVGRDDRGLPVGLQLIGRADSDAALLGLGRQMQGKSEWHAQLPAGIADIVAKVPELIAPAETTKGAR